MHVGAVVMMNSFFKADKQFAVKFPDTVVCRPAEEAGFIKSHDIMCHFHISHLFEAKLSKQ